MQLQRPRACKREAKVIEEDSDYYDEEEQAVNKPRRERPPSEEEEMEATTEIKMSTARTSTLRPRSAVQDSGKTPEPRPIRYKRQKLGGEGNLGIVDVLEDGLED